MELLGYGLILIGAICGGSFGLPSKYAKKDTPWEVLWGPFFLIVTIIMPLIVAPLAVNDLGNIYSKAGTDTILKVLAFGLLWGLGSMTLGMSFSYIGLSLAYALNYGAQIACGFTIPMLLFHADELVKPHGLICLTGVAVCLAGVVVSGRAAILRDQSQKPDSTEDGESHAPADGQPRMLIGVIVAVVSGVLCACYSVAFAFAGPIKEHASAENLNNAAWAVAWAPTAMILWGGAISACTYCIVQLTRNRTWGHFTKPGAGLILLLAAMMAVLHNAAILFYGLGSIELGKLGGAVGYAIFMSFAIIVGNIHGFRSGEWKGASRQSVGWIGVGIAVLVVGICILAGGMARTPG